MSRRKGKAAAKKRVANILTVLIVLLMLVLLAGVLYRLTNDDVPETVEVEKIELDKESIIFGGNG